MLTLICVTVPNTRSLFVCSELGPIPFTLAILIPNCVICISLMILSLWLTFILAKRLNFGGLKSKRLQLYVLEIFVQIMLVGRIMILSSQNALNTASDSLYAIVFCSYLIFTELVPCIYVCYSMFKRLKVYQEAKRLLAQNCPSFSAATSAHTSSSAGSARQMSMEGAGAGGVGRVSEKFADQMIDNIDYAEDVETLLIMSKSQVEQSEKMPVAAHLQNAADSRKSMSEYLTIEDHISKSQHHLLLQKRMEK